MKKKIGLLVLFLLTFATSYSSKVLANSSQTGIFFEKGLPKTENNTPFVARNPQNPALPFPANPIYRNSNSDKFSTVIFNGVNYWGQVEFDFDPQNQEEFIQATDEKPKLYSSRAYLNIPEDTTSGYNSQWGQFSGIEHTGLLYVPHVWDFGTAEVEGNKIILSAIGEAAYYSEEISHLQIWDNRDITQESTWSVRVKMKDWPRAQDGSQLIGSYISLPRGIARNELNKNPELEDKKFSSQEAIFDAENSALIWQTKGRGELEKEGYSNEEILRTGKGMSTLSWNTSEIELHVPVQEQNNAGIYSMQLVWYIEKGPEN